MKISKRTIIIAVVALVLFLGAFISLYVEKQGEINDLLNVPEPEDDQEDDQEPEDEPAPKERKPRAPKMAIVEEPIITEDNGSTEGKE